MRIKNILKNLISEMLPQIVIAFLGIYKSKVFLEYLGADIVGLYNLFAQILGYLSIVEGGIASAVIYRLYKPVHEKDYEKLGQIKNGVKRIFFIISCIILTLGIIAGLIMPHLIKDNTFSISFIVINFLLYVVSEILLYTTIFERSMFTATESNYKLNAIVKTTLILKSIFEIIIAILTRNITYILIMFVLINAISNVVISLISKKQFNYIKKVKEKDYIVLQDVKNLFAHKFAGLIATNIDIVILSSVIGLKEVVIYSTYLLYSSTLTTLMTKISNAFLGRVGNKLLEDKQDSYRIFKEYNAFIFFIAIIVGTQFFFSIDYFINIWYNGEVETNIAISLLFSAILTYNIIRIPLITFTEAAGLFKETRICAILEAVINLVLSLILVHFLGMVGLLIGTLSSLIISEFLIKPKIIFNNVFDKKSKEYYKLCYKFILIILLEMLLVYYIKFNIGISSLLSWLIYSLIFIVLNVIILLFIYIVVFKQKFIVERFKQILSKNKD